MSMIRTKADARPKPLLSEIFLDVSESQHTAYYMSACSSAVGIGDEPRVEGLSQSTVPFRKWATCDSDSFATSFISLRILQNQNEEPDRYHPLVD